MAENKNLKKPVVIVISISIAVLIAAYFIVRSIAVSSAIKVTEETLSTKAEKAAKAAVLREVVREEFIQYIVENVIQEALPNLKQGMADTVLEFIKPVTVEMSRLGEDLSKLKDRTDEIVTEKLATLESKSAVIQKSFSESTQSIHDLIRLTATSMVPSGTVSAFFCKPTSPPRGWLVCDGKTISDASDMQPDHKADNKYTKLVVLLEELGYGEGHNMVRLPDLRGVFLRGTEKDKKVGQYQEDTIKDHKHPIYGEAQSVGLAADSFSDDRYRVFMTEIRERNMPSPRGIFKDSEIQGKSSYDHSNYHADDHAETQPRNVSIVWCIKY